MLFRYSLWTLGVQCYWIGTLHLHVSQFCQLSINRKSFYIVNPETHFQLQRPFYRKNEKNKVYLIITGGNPCNECIDHFLHIPAFQRSVWTAQVSHQLFIRVQTLFCIARLNVRQEVVQRIGSYTSHDCSDAYHWPLTVIISTQILDKPEHNGSARTKNLMTAAAR